MPGKAKQQKHTAKELKSKEFAATGGKAGHAKYKCPVCMQQAPSLKNMKEHFEAKHPKQTFEEEKCIDVHSVAGGTTQGVAVKGGGKK